MNIIRKLAVVFVALGSASAAQADLTSIDDAVFGAGSVTKDTETGFEWLDVTETMGMSFNEVTTQFVAGGLFEGWRYATITEVTTLWNAAGGIEAYYSIGWNSENDGLTEAVGAFTGFTRLDSDVVGSREIFGLMADSPEAGRHQASLLWDNEALVGNVGLDYTNLLWAPILDSTSDSPLASWLVRDTHSVPEPVTIDIKPGSDPNCFNVNGHGVIPVAVLGSDAFDVTLIDQATLSFGGLDVRIRGKKGPLCGLDDTNLDGFYDLVCHFEDNADYWEAGNDDATLTGELLDGTEIEGTDSICIVP